MFTVTWAVELWVFRPGIGPSSANQRQWATRSLAATHGPSLSMAQRSPPPPWVSTFRDPLKSILPCVRLLARQWWKPAEAVCWQREKTGKPSMEMRERGKSSGHERDKRGGLRERERPFCRSRRRRRTWWVRYWGRRRKRVGWSTPTAWSYPGLLSSVLFCFFFFFLMVN